MSLISSPIMARLRTNNARRDEDHIPVVKLFAPWGATTWLITEIESDGETLFGLCDLGVGKPELGYVSLTELSSIRGPFGLKVEVDRHWRTSRTMSAWAKEARELRRIPTIIETD